MRNLINRKNIFAFILGAILFSTITYAAVISSSDVSYNNTNSTLSATTVQGAIDELYEKSSTGCSAGIVRVNKGTGVSSVTGGGMYQKGFSVTIGYTMNTGYHFKDITGDKTTSTFTMPGKDVEVTVNGEINTYKVSYDACGGSGAPSQTTHEYGKSYNVSDTVPTRSNYTFEGWSTSSCSGSVNYASGASFSNLSSTNDATVTMYAVWKSPTCEYRCNNGYYATYTNGEMTSCRYFVTEEYLGNQCQISATLYPSWCKDTSNEKTHYEGLHNNCFDYSNLDYRRLPGGGCPETYNCP